MNGRSKSNTAAVCQEHELCALSAFRFPDAGPPLSGARVPLKKLLIHWIRPLSLNSVRKAHQALRQRPRPSERCNCRVSCVYLLRCERDHTGGSGAAALHHGDSGIDGGAVLEAGALPQQLFDAVDEPIPGERLLEKGRRGPGGPPPEDIVHLVGRHIEDG